MSRFAYGFSLLFAAAAVVVAGADAEVLVD